MGNLSGVVEDLKKELKRAQLDVQKLFRRTRGVGKLKLQWRMYLVSLGSQ
jgi:hypothetical protein